MENRPRTIATVVDREEAQSIAEHIQKALESDAQTILLYTTLEEMTTDPRTLHDFPPPDVYVFEVVYILGVASSLEEVQAQIAEHAEQIDSPNGDL